jgi:hypothetical protein
MRSHRILLLATVALGAVAFPIERAAYLALPSTGGTLYAEGQARGGDSKGGDRGGDDKSGRGGHDDGPDHDQGDDHGRSGDDGPLHDVGDDKGGDRPGKHHRLKLQPAS